jgi:putative transposase
MQTLGGWMRGSAECLTLFYRLLVRRTLDSDVLGTDDTPVKVLDPELDHTRTGRFWTYVGDVRHLVRAALRYVADKDSKAVIRDLKKIYQAATLLEAEQALEDFAQAWQASYPTIIKMWRAKWTDIITLFDFPAPIRKAISTTNAIESVNSVIRKFTRNRKIYPNEASALKITFMAIREASKKWTMPIRNWKAALRNYLKS